MDQFLDLLTPLRQFFIPLRIDTRAPSEFALIPFSISPSVNPFPPPTTTPPSVVSVEGMADPGARGVLGPEGGFVDGREKREVGSTS